MSETLFQMSVTRTNWEI